MKKILFILALLGCSYFGNAQKLTREEARFLCAEFMANFTLSLEPAFKEAGSYEDFQASLLGKNEPTEQGRAQLEAAYNFLQKGLSKDEILKTYSGVEIANSLKFLYELNNAGVVSDGSELFGFETNNEYSKEKEGEEAGTTKCKWYQFWCHIREFANWLVENWPIIKDMLVVIAASF